MGTEYYIEAIQVTVTKCTVKQLTEQAFCYPY